LRYCDPQLWCAPETYLDAFPVSRHAHKYAAALLKHVVQVAPRAVYVTHDCGLLIHFILYLPPQLSLLQQLVSVCCFLLPLRLPPAKPAVQHCRSASAGEPGNHAVVVVVVVGFEHGCFDRLVGAAILQLQSEAAAAAGFWRSELRGTQLLAWKADSSPNLVQPALLLRTLKAILCSTQGIG
jgi:hypothetical protein